MEEWKDVVGYISNRSKQGKKIKGYDIYHSKIEKAKFDKNVNIPIPGAVNFTVPREDLLEIHDTDILKFIKKYVNGLTEKEVKHWYELRQKYL